MNFDSRNLGYSVLSGHSWLHCQSTPGALHDGSRAHVGTRSAVLDSYNAIVYPRSLLVDSLKVNTHSDKVKI